MTPSSVSFNPNSQIQLNWSNRFKWEKPSALLMIYYHNLAPESNFLISKTLNQSDVHQVRQVCNSGILLFYERDDQEWSIWVSFSAAYLPRVVSTLSLNNRIKWIKNETVNWRSVMVKLLQEHHHSDRYVEQRLELMMVAVYLSGLRRIHGHHHCRHGNALIVMETSWFWCVTATHQHTSPTGFIQSVSDVREFYCKHHV